VHLKATRDFGLSWHERARYPDNSRYCTMHSVIGVACFVSVRQNCSDNAVATVRSEVIARQPHLPERVG
jgi:hypothetical protein